MLEIKMKNSWSTKEYENSPQVTDGQSCGLFCLRIIEFCLREEEITGCSNFDAYRWKVCRNLLNLSSEGKQILEAFQFNRNEVISFFKA